jgi:ABC-2 type transport system permease protein
MREALWAELLKARRSRLPALTALAFTIVAVVCGLFMFILADPSRARALGLLGDKAQLSGASADWPGYLALLAQAVAVGGMLIYGMIAIWLFGREFSDHTAKDLLALPTSRTTIVAAKSPSPPPGRCCWPCRSPCSACSSALSSPCPAGQPKPPHRASCGSSSPPP